ncbi:DUF1972 domain-containing protein [Confluentibacter sediminis]|uniref:DUF1972 domain-containing protein n=1 Tax=Confluentibacter sediminis TaxID=2219045 RepID=UPI000DAC292D|nr:DUF1972 domain-containing protein [Confluentibacter sediminis]
MKIAVIGIRGLPASYSGFETCAEHTTKQWVKNKHEVVVYCRSHIYESKIPKTTEGVYLKYLPSLPIKSLETLSHTFLSVLHLCFIEKNIKIIHLYNCGNGIFIPILKLFGKKTFISVDGLEWKRKKWGFIAKSMYKFGAKVAVKFSNELIVDNKVVQDFYSYKFNKETSLIAYGAKIIEKSKMTSEEVFNKFELKSKEYFLFVGRFVKEKGVLNLIKSYLELNTHYPLVIIGDDVENNEYRDYIFSTYNAHPKIKLLGYRFGDEYEAILSNALMYVSASELEGTSPSLLAAMGAKTCTLVNGIEENLTTLGGSGSVFEKNDYNDLVKKWQYYIDNPTIIDKMALKGYKYVLENYSWSKISKDYISLFEKNNYS